MTELTADDAAQVELASAMVPDLRRILPSALIAGVLPVIAYGILRKHVSSDSTALAAVMVIPVTYIGLERLKRGRFDPVGVIALVGISIGLGGALVFHGNDLLLKLRDSTITGLFAIACLASLVRERPLMFAFAKLFATDGDPEKVARFELIWQREGVPQRFRFMTVVWGLALLGEASIRIALALTLSTQTFLAISPVVSWIVLGSLIVFSMRFIRASQSDLLAPVPTAASA